MEYLDWCKDRKDHTTPGWIIDIAFFNPYKNQKIDYIFEKHPLYAYDYKQHSDTSECIDYSHVTINFPFCKEYHVLKEKMLENTLLDITLFQLTNNQQVERAIAFHKCNITEISEYNNEITLKFDYLEESISYKTEKGIHATNLNFEEYTVFEKTYKNLHQYLEYSEEKKVKPSSEQKFSEF